MKWTASIILAPKMDWALCSCVDNGKRNASIFRDSYPLPRIEEYIDYLEYVRIFSTMNVSSRYLQIKLHEEDQEKSISTLYQAYFPASKQLGLKNGPGSFQRAVGVMFVTGEWQFVPLYLEDIIIFLNLISDTLNMYVKYKNCGQPLY